MACDKLWPGTYKVATLPRLGVLGGAKGGILEERRSRTEGSRGCARWGQGWGSQHVDTSWAQGRERVRLELGTRESTEEGTG